MSEMNSMDHKHSHYRPTMEERYVDQIRRWHEQTYRSARERAVSSRTFSYLGLTLEVPPQVMPVTPLSSLLGKAVLEEVQESDRVLDMGTGSGANAILAASKATDVVAVDINPESLEASRANAIANGVAERIDVHYSDVFSNVDGKFDLVIFDPPSRWFPARELLEMASTDQDYRALTQFIRNVRNYLRPDGRILLFFGTHGDLAYLLSTITDAGLRAKVIAHKDRIKEGRRLDYFTFRITPAGGRTAPKA